VGIGVGILLAAAGAILAFAVDVHVSGLDLAAVGWILMVAGVVGVALDLALFRPRRRRTVHESVARTYPDDPTYGEPYAQRRREHITTVDEPDYDPRYGGRP
jgi:Domain of unknown function (DUF6458)